MTTNYAECAIHGRDQLYVWSSICNGYICIECVKDNLFIEDIEKEIVDQYPKLFEKTES